MLQNQIKRSAWLTTGLWTIAVLVFLALNIRQEYRNVEAQAAKVARANLDKDQAFRQWVTDRGGLYGKVSDVIKPNPYLAHVSRRDLSTSAGELTLLNPAHILRLVIENYTELYGIEGRLVSTKPLNPKNIADDWEVNVLNKFDGNPAMQNYSEITTTKGEDKMRMMVPMRMNDKCLMCHSVLGFKVGDLAGGVNIAIPMAPYYAVAKNVSFNLFYTNTLIWMLGIVGIIFITQRALKYAELREQSYSEQRLAARVFDDGLQAIIITNKDGEIERVNQRFCEITGYSEEESIGQTPRILKSGHQDETFYKKLWQGILKEGKWQGELINRRKNGEEFYTWQSIVALTDVNGEPKNIIGLFEDITERKLAENKLKVLNDELEDRVRERTAELEVAKEASEQANQAKSEFLSSMSHELRTPLNSILGYSQLLSMQDNLGQDDIDNVSEIEKAGHHLLTLINEILDLSRIEAGSIEITPEPVNVRSVVAECYLMVTGKAEEKNIHIKPCNADCTRRVMADPMRFKQVILNLMSNAVKYNVQDGEVEASCVDLDDGMVRICITDTGMGIDPAEQEGVFQPFNRLGKESSAIEGTGIGLVIARQLVELMGGNIGFESKVGKGSTFWIELPIATDAVADKASENTVEYQNHHADDVAAGPSQMILYVEDNSANQRLIERVISSQTNLDIRIESSAEEALDRISEVKPDLIILDINLPGMNGYEMLSKLRNDGDARNIPVIGLSAKAMKSDMEYAESVGFDSYITKPVNVPELLNAVDELLPEH